MQVIKDLDDKVHLRCTLCETEFYVEKKGSLRGKMYAVTCPNPDCLVTDCTVQLRPRKYPLLADIWWKLGDAILLLISSILFGISFKSGSLIFGIIGFTLVLFFIVHRWLWDRWSHPADVLLIIFSAILLGIFYVRKWPLSNALGIILIPIAIVIKWYSDNPNWGFGIQALANSWNLPLFIMILSVVLFCISLIYGSFVFILIGSLVMLIAIIVRYFHYS